MRHVAWRSTPALVRSRADTDRAREALVDGDVRLSFGELAGAVERAARAFIASGVGHGDRVAIWAPNLHEWVVSALGLHSVGAVLVPLNTRFKGEEAGDILGRSGARLLLTVNGFLGTDYVALLRDALGGAGEGHPVRKLPLLREIVALRGDASSDTASWAQFLARAEGVAPEESERRAAGVGPDDLADIMFTSGTTGRPKGAMLTHGQMLRAYVTACEIVGIRSDDRYLIVPPFFHSFGYRFGFVTALIAGATALPIAVFDPVATMALIEKEAITFLPGPPTLYHSLLNHPDRGDFDLSSLRSTLTGAASVPVRLIERLRDELSFETVITAYGLTESTGVATICRRDDDPSTIAETSGRAFPGVEVIVANEEGAEVPRGQRGEVLIRGFNVMQGYLDDPGQTADVMGPGGWLHTGDVGVMDDAGYLRIVDRRKDMFIVGGFNVYPAEVEALLLANDKISQVAVVGAPDERLGEVGAAFVQLRPDEEASAQEIIDWCQRRLANFKVPRFVEFVESLPLNASGKVLKYVLRERARLRVSDEPGFPGHRDSAR